MKQTSYVMVKPGFANSKEVIEEIKKRLASKGIKIEEEGYIRYDKKHADEHYAEHIGKSFFPELEQYIMSDKAYGMKVSGEDAITKIRELAGSTKNPVPGTIRFDIPAMLGVERDITANVVHSSDSVEAAKRELAIFEEIKLEQEKASSSENGMMM